MIGGMGASLQADTRGAMATLSAIATKNFVKRLQEQVAGGQSAYLEAISISLSRADVDFIEQICSAGVEYSELRNAYDSQRVELVALAHRYHQARELLYPQGQSTEKSISRRRAQALGALGFATETDNLVSDYEHLLSQFCVEPLARRWYTRVPPDLFEEFREVFEPADLMATQSRDQSGVAADDRIGLRKTQLIELLAKKYLRQPASVRKLLHRRGIRNLPRVD